MTTQDARMLAERAVEGDLEAWRELYLAIQFREAMEHIFNTYDLRDALVIIGKHYGGARSTQLRDVFKLDRKSIWRVLNASKN